MLTSQAFRDFPLSLSLSRLQEPFKTTHPAVVFPLVVMQPSITPLNRLHNHSLPRSWSAEKPPTTQMVVSLKTATGFLSLGHADVPPFLTRGIAHSIQTEFSLIPPRYFISGILSADISLIRISHSRHSVRPKFHPPGCLTSGLVRRHSIHPDVSHPKLSADIPPYPNVSPPAPGVWTTKPPQAFLAFRLGSHDCKAYPWGLFLQVWIKWLRGW